jgi:protein N-terminal methyltransferase
VGLLLDGIAEQVDVIEPIARFTANLQNTPGVRSIFNMGLEDWQPTEGTQYDLVWIQWCVGHLTDEQLVAFLKRCKATLNPDGGVIVVKENNSTEDADEFDDVDSSVTRCADASFSAKATAANRDSRTDRSLRRIFEEAGLRLLQVQLQRGLNPGGRSLLPVRMYALKPAQ